MKITALCDLYIKFQKSNSLVRLLIRYWIFNPVNFNIVNVN
jgi:hypothetical protein